MQDESSQPPDMNAQIQRALCHPRRTEIFSYLMGKVDGTSEGELADEFGIGTRLLAYHLKVLSDADLIAHVEDREQGTADRYVAAASAGP